MIDWTMRSMEQCGKGKAWLAMLGEQDGVTRFEGGSARRVALICVAGEQPHSLRELEASRLLVRVLTAQAAESQAASRTRVRSEEAAHRAEMTRRTRGRTTAANDSTHARTEHKQCGRR